MSRTKSGTGYKIQTIRLSAAAGLQRRNVEVLVYPDGRAFASGNGWKRLCHEDPRVKTAAYRDVRGSIDIVPLNILGLFFRAPEGHVEVSVWREGYTLVWYRDPCEGWFGGPYSIHQILVQTGLGTLRQMASLLTRGEVGEVLLDDWICPECGNTGKIDTGACKVPRCVTNRQGNEQVRTHQE